MKSIRALQTMMFMGLSLFAAAESGLPSGDGYVCWNSVVPDCDPCQKLGGKGTGNSTSGGPEAVIGLGQSNSPVLPDQAFGSVSDGSKSIADGMSNVPKAKMPYFAEMNLSTGYPVLRRLDADHSSNGLFGLSLERLYIAYPINYSENTNGRTMFGPGWTCNFDVRLEKYSSSVDGFYLRLDTSQPVSFEPTSQSGVYRANPDVMAATLSVMGAPEWNQPKYKLEIAGGDAVYLFDGYGYLLSIRDRNNNGLDLEYYWRPYEDQDKQLVKVKATAPDTRFIEFEYETVASNVSLRTAHVIKATTSWNNRSVHYSYYEFGGLHEVRDHWMNLIERYDRIPPEWADFEEYFYSWLSVIRPNGNGDEVYSASYVVDLGRKYDGAATLLIWPDGHRTQSYRDAMGEGLHVPGASHDHYFTPGYWETVDKNNAPGQQIVRAQWQDMKDANQGYLPHGSKIPNKTCSCLEGSGASNYYLSCDCANSGTQYDYHGDVDLSDPYDYSYHQIKTLSQDGMPDAHYFYTPQGRVSGIWYSDDRHTSYTYDLKGNVIAKVENGVKNTNYTLDSLGRVSAVTTDLGTTTYIHDDWGHVRAVTDVEGRTVYTDYNAQGLKTAVGSLGTTTTYEYDYKDRLTTATNALGHKTVYAYNAINQVTSVTDPLGNATTYDYSPTTGTLTSVTDAEGGVISYEYDLFGHMTKLIDQRGKETVYEYDAFGRLISETNPLNQTTEYEYDDHAGCGSCGTSGGSGHVSSITDPAGRTTFYEYGPGDRLTTVTYSASSDMVVHSYDDFGRRISTFDNRLPVADFPTQTFAWEYDNFDRMTKEIYPDGEEVAWEYDLHGRRTKMTDPDGNHTQYVYANAANNKKLASITHSLTGTTAFGYNADGQLSDETHGNYTTVAYGYDTLNRVTSIINWNSEVNAIYDLDNITYNAAGMITSINGFRELNGGESYVRSYTYDDVYRLTGQSDVVTNVAPHQTRWSYTYTFDDAGNRTQMDYHKNGVTATTTYSYNDFNQLTSTYIAAGNSYYAYDASGNMDTFDDIRYQYTYAHDRENRLLDVSGDFPGPDYVYDFSGRLLMRTGTDNVKRKYYYDGINTLMTREIPSAINTSCFRTASVFTLKESAIGQIVAESQYDYATEACWEEPAPINRWYHYDHIGNAVGQTNSAGYTTQVFNMEAYGKVEQGSQGGIRLTTKEYDPSSGLYYFGARWYDMAVGRWLGKEPRGNDGPNLYHFNFDNPISMFDPDGRLVIVIPFAPAAWTAGAAAVCKCTALVGSAAVTAYGTVCLYRSRDEVVPISRPKPPVIPDQCEAQYSSDVSHCSSHNVPATMKRACYDQAAQRYSACISGRSIPPFPY